MKLYTSMGPNPRAVTLFIAEKGLSIPTVEVDLRGGENRQAPYLKLNPTGGLPTLELDDGAHLSEIVAICEYLEELHPQPPLFGATPEERAATRMWARRIDLKICEPLVNGFRFAEGLGLFQPRMRCLPEAAPGLKAVARDGLAWLEAQFDGPWVVGERFSFADILLYAFVEFGAMVGQPLDPELAKLTAWLGRMKTRPSIAVPA